VIKLLTEGIGMKYNKHRIKASSDNISRAIDMYIVGYKALRNREILKDHYILGLTFEEVAEKHDMSTRHVKKIIYDNESVVIDHLRVED
jgi:hypothetical protein